MAIKQYFSGIAGGCLLLCPISVWAQDQPNPAVVAPTIPALTPVHLEIMTAQGSAISKPDSRFPIRLVEPIMLNDREVVPAGTMGEGEVVHAKKASASGGPGELILAARWLDVKGRQLKLRSLHIAQTGSSAIKDVNRASMAAAATVPAVAVIGLFVTGKEIVIPAGTLAEAKVAADFAVQP